MGDVYRELLEMINREDVVGLPDTPAMRRVLAVSYTHLTLPTN